VEIPWILDLLFANNICSNFSSNKKLSKKNLERQKVVSLKGILGLHVGGCPKPWVHNG